MSRRTVLAWLPGAAFVSAFTMLAVSIALRTFGEGGESPQWAVPGAIVPLVLAIGASGWVVASRRPENAVGWILCGMGFGASLTELGNAYATVGLGSRPLPGALAAAWFASWAWMLFIMGPLGIVFQLFPTGNPLSARWRRVLVVAAVLIGLAALHSAFAPGRLNNYESLQNPFALRGVLGGVLAAGAFLGGIVIVLGLVVGAVSLIVRFRRSSGIERAQLKWLTAAAAACGFAFVMYLVVDPLVGPGLTRALETVAAASVMCFPAAIAVAISRYRLWEIDRIINRTLVYAALTIVLGGSYAGGVLLFQWVTSPFTGSSAIAVAFSTLVIATMFRPVRARVQAVVDRRFNRARYDAERTLEAFGTRLRDELDLSTLTAELRSVVQRAIEPDGVGLWLRGDPVTRAR
jgi:hypothetical protein